MSYWLDHRENLVKNWLSFSYPSAVIFVNDRHSHWGSFACAVVFLHLHLHLHLHLNSSTKHKTAKLRENLNSWIKIILFLTASSFTTTLREEWSGIWIYTRPLPCYRSVRAHGGALQNEQGEHRGCSNSGLYVARSCCWRKRCVVLLISEICSRHSQPTLDHNLHLRPQNIQHILMYFLLLTLQSSWHPENKANTSPFALK